MSTRAAEQPQNLVIKRFTVPNGQTATAKRAVVPSGTGVTAAGADSDLAIGIAMSTVVGVAAGTAQVDVALFAYATKRVTCGTGGSTFGKKQILVADGFTDAPADNGATTPKPTYGYALETAVAGDDFELAMSGPANRTTT